MFFFTLPAYAADFEITCDSNGCFGATDAIFPSSQIWFPGKSLTKSIRVVNNGGNTLTVSNKASNLSISKSLDTVLNLKIDRLLGGASLFQNSLSSFYAASGVDLSTIGANSSDEYLYTVSMNTEAGNELQNASTKFDLQINFAGGAPDGGPGTGGSSSSNNTSSTCSATTPAALQNLRVTGYSANTVSLSWDSTSPTTHYALIFTRLSDGAKYGSTNIGNGNSYTINNISGGNEYEFEVFGVNDCAPGASDKVVRTITGAITSGRPTGVSGEVLGDNVATGSGRVISELPTPPSPEVLSASNSICNEPNWKTLFMVVIVLMPILFQLFNKFVFFKKPILTFAIVFLVAIIVDRNYFCTHSYWWLGLIAMSQLITNYLFWRIHPVSN